MTRVTVGQRKKVTAVTFFPARPRPDQRGTNTGQIRKIPVDEIAWCLVYRLDETRSQLSANKGILVCLVREIWQFKVFAGKEVTAVTFFRCPTVRVIQLFFCNWAKQTCAHKAFTVLLLKELKEVINNLHSSPGSKKVRDPEAFVMNSRVCLRLCFDGYQVIRKIIQQKTCYTSTSSLKYDRVGKSDASIILYQLRKTTSISSWSKGNCGNLRTLPL